MLLALNPSPRYAFYLIFLSLACLILPVVIQRLTSDHSLHVCYINREIEKPSATIIPIRDGPLHNYSVYVMWISMFILALLPVERPLAFFQLIYASIWFHSTYILLAALKALMEDFQCAGRHKLYPNGISGHYCYFLFVSLTAPLLARARLKANPQTPKSVIYSVALLLGLFAIGAGATLYRTFFHGYHSVRQILFGSSLGLLSHAVLFLVLFHRRKGETLLLKMFAQFSVSLTVIVMYYNWWPHQSAGPAISSTQLLFHAVLYAFLLVSNSFIPVAEGKDR